MPSGLRMRRYAELGAEDLAHSRLMEQSATSIHVHVAAESCSHILDIKNKCKLVGYFTLKFLVIFTDFVCNFLLDTICTAKQQTSIAKEQL